MPERATMIVWISGPTGSGKSSFARALTGLGYVVVQEELPKELFAAFSSEPAANCEALQSAIMRSRFAKWQALRAEPRIVFDRSLDEDVGVFCRMHHELGLLDDCQLKRLQALASELQNPMPPPDLIVYLRPDRQILDQRLRWQGHPSIIVENLDRQLSIYSKWLGTKRNDLLMLDNSGCSLHTVQRFLSGREKC
jgi:deoxyadenosine/deoxycytidine kinase